MYGARQHYSCVYFGFVGGLWSEEGRCILGEKVVRAFRAMSMDTSNDEYMHAQACARSIEKREIDRERKIADYDESHTRRKTACGCARILAKTCIKSPFLVHMFTKISMRRARR